MTAKNGGYFSRLIRKLTRDVADLDAEDLSAESRAKGAQRACDCHCGDEVTVLGRLRSVELGPTAGTPALQAELFDGTEEITVIWLGRRRITGIEPGRTIKVQGRLAERQGKKVLYNPYYELQQTV